MKRTEAIRWRLPLVSTTKSITGPQTESVISFPYIKMSKNQESLITHPGLPKESEENGRIGGHCDNFIHVHIQEALHWIQLTENNLKTTEQTIYIWQRSEHHIEKGKGAELWMTGIHALPHLSPQAGGRGMEWEGINTQEHSTPALRICSRKISLHCTGLWRLTWLDTWESWSTVRSPISSCCGGSRCSFDLLKSNTEAAMWKSCPGKHARASEWALSGGKRAGRLSFPALPQPNWPGTCRIQLWNSPPTPQAQHQHLTADLTHPTHSAQL